MTGEDTTYISGLDLEGEARKQKRQEKSKKLEPGTNQIEHKGHKVIQQI